MICPACGASEWSLVQHEGAAYLLQVIEEEEAELSAIPVGYGLVVAPQFCDSCGYVRLHAVRDTTDQAPLGFTEPS